MPDKNFIRYFVILNENIPSQSSQKAGGYCKVEGMDSKAIFTLSLRNMRFSTQKYSAYIVSKSNSEPIKMGDFLPSGDGTVYMEYNTEQQNIFQSDTNANSVEAVYILDSNNEIILSGYTNRNISEKAKNDCGIKLQSIIKNEETVDIEPLNINELDYNGDVPAEIESTSNALEALNTQISDSDCNEDKNEDLSKNTESNENQNRFSSYLDTFTKLYEGLVGSKSVKQTDTDKTVQNGYRQKTQVYFENMSNSGESVEPFPFQQLNSKWVRISNGISSYLFGTVYENGRIKYIANGIPTTLCSFAIPSTNKSTIWLPSADNSCGITGYWVTFIDAENGNAAIPDISIL